MVDYQMEVQTGKYLNPRTRGTSNYVISVGVVINELFSRGTAAELDWIEIYNPSILIN